MENASKALLMAAGIIIGIIILSLGVYLVNISRGFAEQYDETLSEQKLQAFNAPFVAVDGRNNVSPHEILSLAYKANYYNNPDTSLAGYYNNGDIATTDSQYIHVYVKFTNTNKVDLAEYLQNNKNKLDTDQFISGFLDGSYVYGLYSNSLEKYGQFQYEAGRNKYYNSYECSVTTNPNTGRINSVTCVFKPSALKLNT